MTDDEYEMVQCLAMFGRNVCEGKLDSDDGRANVGFALAVVGETLDSFKDFEAKTLAISLVEITQHAIRDPSVREEARVRFDEVLNFRRIRLVEAV